MIKFNLLLEDISDIKSRTIAKQEYKGCKTFSAKWNLKLRRLNCREFKTLKKGLTLYNTIPSN